MQNMDVLSGLRVDNNIIKTTSQYEFSFDVVTTNNIFDLNNTAILNVCKGKKLLIVISETIETLYGERIRNYFEGNYKPEMFKIIIINTTEANKNIENVLSVCKAGKEFGLDRTSLMVAIGGGILMDIVGFASSIFKRKLNYIRIPTTLVGHIDAGVGIKTGVNFSGSKNYIGAFHPPVNVINDIDFLKTLPVKEIVCGLSEIIKMGIIVDMELFELVESHYAVLIEGRYQGDILISNRVNNLAIVGMLKQLIINFYENDLERLVDFGHTFSPFIEEYTNYRVKHGIAVAMDMAISTEISYLLNKISKNERNRILNLILNIGVNIYDEKIYNTQLMYKSLINIVLHRGGDLNLVIPTEIGQATFIKSLDEVPCYLLQVVFENLKNYQLSGSVTDENSIGV
ncbi:sedoheptulose 7-phosphate cyclase [Paenibacillus sp. GCM10012307]|uniref:Sedoheptulose 7-phosphate cyclase n=1 Tax=Paenibacillus roseus TaxID=2798579 RepID=A0A934MPP5_9BACL|nr:sedoheptulose 7-phosphate cyclase [Paenibacillus roseus]MBJ6361088.1 sedoheptulose 7-phosphate cyclase [Paenibacillus roseus]